MRAISRSILKQKTYVRRTLDYFYSFLLIRIFIYFAICLFFLRLSGEVFQLFLMWRYPNPLLRYISSLAYDPYLKVIFAVTSVLVYRGLVASFECRPISELAVRKLAKELIAGLLLSLGLMAIVCGILATLGDVALAETPGWTEVLTSHLSASVMVAGGAAVLEEILFRGVLFRLLEQGGGTGVALTLSALLFGLLHAMNSDTSMVNALFIAVEAGLPLAMAYAVTQRLWLPIGLHLGWDLAYGRVFGSTVYGQHVVGLLVLNSQAGSSVKTSVMTALPSIAIAAYLGWSANLRGRWQPVKLHFRIGGNGAATP